MRLTPATGSGIALKAAVEFAVVNEPAADRRAALRWALAVAAQRSAHQLNGEPVPETVAAEWARADQLVLSGLRAKLGLDRVRWAMSGRRSDPGRNTGFLRRTRDPDRRDLGHVRTHCICSVSHPRDARLGTVGKLLPGMRARIADDGELHGRGPLVMKGYRGEPEQTAEAVDTEGWLRTGDVLTVDSDGYLTVVDRKKELIINSAGKNMSPTNIENTIKAATPLIGAIAALGDGRPYNTALVVLDAETAGPYAARHDLPDASAPALAADTGVIERIAAGIAAGNAKLPRVEQVERFRVLPVFWEAGGDEVTLTMKLERRVIAGKYATEIAELYDPDLGPAVHEPRSASADSAVTTA